MSGEHITDRLSPHFRRSEFQCPHCGRVRVDLELVQLLERIRGLSGRPLRVLSGYRCVVHNRTVGGATHSQHLLGKAADISHGIVTPPVARDLGATGVGRSGAWAVHVDVRDGAYTEWRY